jgi:hypothetical protein
VPRRDVHHEAVKHALVKDAWVITHDPLTLSIGAHNLFVDLGAERLLAAERGGERIAVEIKSFVGASAVADVELALGQYLLYRSLLQRNEPDRRLVLAVPAAAYESILSSDLGQTVRADYSVALLVFDPQAEVISQWLP